MTLGAWIGCAVLAPIFMYLEPLWMKLIFAALFVTLLRLYTRSRGHEKKTQDIRQGAQFWDRTWWRNALLGISIFAVPYVVGLSLMGVIRGGNYDLLSNIVVGLIFGVFMGIGMKWSYKWHLKRLSENAIIAL
ncbi:MAG: hypothetical protein AAGK66_06535 [Pseudomonadota bacterium]